MRAGHHPTNENAHIYLGDRPMKHLSSISFLLSVLVLLCGCGGGESASGAPSGAPDPQADPPAPALKAANNWQLSTTSTKGFPPTTIAGGIAPSAVPVSGAVHVDGSTCFDKLTAVDLTGTLNGSTLSLTSASVSGQVMTLTGSTAEDPVTKFTGTYSIQGGCADGDQGNVTGVELTPVGGPWAGDLTSEAGDINRIAVTLAQGSATTEGTFGLTGNATFESGTCFKWGTVASGKFPSGSYVMGTDVTLVITTDNGVISFLGSSAAKYGGLIRGNYTVIGGTCESAGTGYLSPWEY